MNIVVYRLYGHYSLKARDGGHPVTLALAAGYKVGDGFDGAQMIVGRELIWSIEQAIYHGFARVVA